MRVIFWMRRAWFFEDLRDFEAAKRCERLAWEALDRERAAHAAEIERLRNPAPAR